MWRCVDLMWTDVSEERIASIFRVEKFASEEPAWAGCCGLGHQSKTPSYIRIGKEGEWATREINREERGRVCRGQVGRPGEQVAERGAEPVAVRWRGGGCFRLVAVCSHLLTLLPRSRVFLPWRRRRYVPPKRRFTQDLHSATSHKTAFFIVTAAKTSNLTFEVHFNIKY
jgi:hypothetical protein